MLRLTKIVKCHPNLSIFTVFLKYRNCMSKIRKLKVTDYAALRQGLAMEYMTYSFFNEIHDILYIAQSMRQVGMEECSPDLICF